MRANLLVTNKISHCMSARISSACVATRRRHGEQPFVFTDLGDGICLAEVLPFAERARSSARCVPAKLLVIGLFLPPESYGTPVRSCFARRWIRPIFAGLTA
jgi:hypothetical protein